jgi:hypothetical protein
MWKMYTKAPPPCYFEWRAPEEIPIKFNNKLCGKFFLDFILFYFYINKIGYNVYKKWDAIKMRKNIYVRISQC